MCMSFPFSICLSLDLLVLILQFRNKAVSDGAISYHLDHFVNTRISTLTYGNVCHIPFNEHDAEHRNRMNAVFQGISGGRRIGGFYDVILPKVRGYFLFSEVI